MGCDYPHLGVSKGLQKMVRNDGWVSPHFALFFAECLFHKINEL